MVIDVLPAVVAQKSVIRQMMELYFHDLSEFEDIEMDEYGHFGYKYLDPYWSEDNRHPFLVTAEGKLAGFVLVNQHTLLPASEYAIAEFFILRKYRRQQIGKTVACRIFSMFPGYWESHQTVENKIAQQFWRKIIEGYTHGQYSECKTVDRDSIKIVQSFKNQRL